VCGGRPTGRPLEDTRIRKYKHYQPASGLYSRIRVFSAARSAAPQTWRTGGLLRGLCMLRQESISARDRPRGTRSLSAHEGIDAHRSSPLIESVDGCDLLVAPVGVPSQLVSRDSGGALNQAGAGMTARAKLRPPNDDR